MFTDVECIPLFKQHVKAGDVYEDAHVVRIDRRSGLLLEIPSSPVHTPAFVKVCVHLYMCERLCIVVLPVCSVVVYIDMFLDLVAKAITN